MKLLPNNIDVNRCAQLVGNTFDLILIAAVRTRELNRGAKTLITGQHKSTVTALEEIQAGTVGRELLRRVGARRGK
jgi:DNA-directed RNA polymerase omega subunit